MRNSRRAGLLAAVFGLGLVSTGMPANAESLADAIALAYKTNPTILNARSTLRNADETYFQRRISLVDPTLTIGSITTSLSDSQDLLHGGNDTGGSLNIGATAGLSQTLYNGGRIATGMDSARNTLLTSRETWRSAEMNLLVTVVRAYTGVRQAEAALTVGQSSLSIQQKNVSDAQAKYDVGTITISELKTNQANYAAQQASVFSQQTNLDNARNTYLTSIGQLPGTLTQEPDISPFLPKTLDEAYKSAQQNSTTIRTAYLTERNAAIALANAKAPYKPTATASVTTTFGDAASFGSFPSQLGFDTTTGRLAATLSFNVPLWPGRAQNSTVRSAEETYRAAQYSLDQARRTLYQTVSSDWNTLENNRRQVQVQTFQVSAREVAQAGFTEQYLQGAAQLADKLNADQALATAQQSLVNAQFTLFTSGVTLLQDVGTLSTETFGVTGIEKYDPKVHFDEVNGHGSSGWAEWVENIDRTYGEKVPAFLPKPGEVIPAFDRP